MKFTNKMLYDKTEQKKKLDELDAYDNQVKCELDFVEDLEAEENYLATLSNKIIFPGMIRIEVRELGKTTSKSLTVSKQGLIELLQKKLKDVTDLDHKLSEEFETI